MIQLGVGTRDEAWGTVRADADLIALLMRDGWGVTVEVGEETGAIRPEAYEVQPE